MQRDGASSAVSSNFQLLVNKRETGREPLNCSESFSQSAGVVGILVSDLTGFPAEQPQMSCATVSEFDTNSQHITRLF